MARSQPITWRNVSVDNGASAAAFGNSAANFGRTALQGLEIFSDQMTDRINREDTLLTNDAIAAALSGGPTVSKNRRVDANALQTAVERDALGNRQERALEDDLLSSSVNRRLNSANAGIAEYNLETAPDRWDFEKRMKEAEIEMQQARAANDTARLKIAQRQVSELDRIQKGREGFNSYLYGPEITGQADAEFDAKWAQNPDAANASPQQKAELRKIAREQFRQRFIQDPNNLYTLGQRFNLQPLEVEQYTAVGRDSREAAVATRQSLADIAAANTEEATKLRTAAEAVAGGDTSKILWDGSNWTYGSGDKVNGAVKSDTMARLGLKEDDKRASAFSNAVQAAFPTGSAYRAAMEQLIGKFGKDGIPDEEAYRREIDSLSQGVRSQADRDSKIRAESFVAASTEDLINNFVDSITQALPAADSDPKDTAAALSADPALTADYIAQIPVSGFTSTQQVQDSRNQLQTVVEGLQEKQKEIKLPEDASREVRILYNRYKNAVDVANGGAYLPEVNANFGMGLAAIPTPQQPTFEVRKDHAEKATRLLQDLLGQMKADSDAATERSFQDQLNAR